MRVIAGQTIYLVGDVAKALGVTVNRVHALCASGRLPEPPQVEPTSRMRWWTAEQFERICAWQRTRHAAVARKA